MKGFHIFWFIGLFCAVLSLGLSYFLLSKSAKFATERITEAGMPKVVKDEKEFPEEETPGFWSFRSREIENLVVRLKERSHELDKREERIKSMERYIQAEKKELEVSLSQIEEIKKEFYESILNIQDEESDNIDSLAKAYENLPPENLVELFSEMDDVFVLRVLRRFQSDFIAAIFQAMMSEGSDDAIKRVADLSEMMRLASVEK